MKLRKISIDNIERIFSNISLINEQIKGRDIGIQKSGFYGLKKSIIHYVITLINRGIYTKDEISYRILGVERQLIEDGNQTKDWMLVEFLVNNNTYLYHTELRGLTICKILDEYVKTNKVTLTKYNKKTEIVFSNTNEELRNMYAEVIDIMCQLNWCIYRICDNETFINIISARYNNLVIKMQDDGSFGKFKNKLVKIKVKKKVWVENILLSDLRFNCHNIFRKIMKDKFLINYNFK